MYRLTILLCATLFLTLPAPAQEEPTTVLATIDPDGSQFPEVSTFPADISADGRFVVFAAYPCGNCGPRVYRRDRASESTELVSVDSDGNEFSGYPQKISADGRFVVLRGGGGGVYSRRDMDAGALEPIVLPTTDGEPPNSGTFADFAISADARFIAFSTSATNLLPGGAESSDVYVYDTDTDRLERVSVASDGSSANQRSKYVDISPDGRYVAFMSHASNLVPDDTNDETDIFVHDRNTGTTERVSVASDGSEGNGPSGSTNNNGIPSISADGRYVAFRSFASNLVPDDTNGNGDVFVHDRNTGTTERVSVASDGSEGSWGWGTVANISPDGRFVSFYGGDLEPDDTNGQPDTYIHDRETGTTELVSVAHDGSQILGADNKNALSADGRFVVFATIDPNVVPGGTNGEHHYFVRDRGAQIVATEDGPTAFHLSNATPNPASGSTSLSLRVPEAQNVTARVYDALGRQVATIHDGSLAAGEDVRLEIDTTNLTAGVYVVRVEGETFAETRRVTVVR